MSDELNNAAAAAEAQAPKDGEDLVTIGGPGVAEALGTGDEPARPEKVKQGKPAHPQKKHNKKKRDPGANDRRPAIKFDADTPGERPKHNANKVRRDPNSSRTLARESSLAFVPMASHPAEPYHLQLRTEYTRRLFQDHYGRAQISLYNLMQYLPIRLRIRRLDNDRHKSFMEELEADIDGRIGEITRRLKADLSRARKVGNDNNIQPVAVYSKDALPVSLAQLTPQIVDLLDLLPVFDEFIAYLDQFYIRRTVTRTSREETINTYRNDIVTLIRLFMHLYHESKRLIEKGEGADFKSMLRPVDPGLLRETLDAHEEEQARQLTGAAESAPLAA